MPDTFDDTAAEPVETAQAAVEPTSTPVPWGDDFNAERAWKTITHLRDRERELETDAKAYKRLSSGEDLDSLREIASKYDYELPEDEPEVPEYDLEDDPIADVRKSVDELRQWREQQQVNEALSVFHKDIDTKAEQAKVTLDQVDRDWLLQESIKGGFTQDAVNKAFGALQERNSALEKQAIERYLASKRGPTPPQPGKAGATEFDHSDRKGRQARMAAIIAAADQPT